MVYKNHPACHEKASGGRPRESSACWLMLASHEALPSLVVWIIHDGHMRAAVRCHLQVQLLDRDCNLMRWKQSPRVLCSMLFMCSICMFMSFDVRLVRVLTRLPYLMKVATSPITDQLAIPGLTCSLDWLHCSEDIPLNKEVGNLVDFHSVDQPFQDDFPPEVISNMKEI